MNRLLSICLAIAASAVCAPSQQKKPAAAPKRAAAAPKKLELKDLPPAVQKTVQSELKNYEIKNIGKETEDGITQYEVETIVNGKHRDFNVDTKGALLVVEEETRID